MGNRREQSPSDLLGLKLRSCGLQFEQLHWDWENSKIVGYEKILELIQKLIDFVKLFDNFPKKSNDPNEVDITRSNEFEM